MNAVEHGEWLKSRGYRQDKVTWHDLSYAYHYQKKGSSDDIFCEVVAYVPKEYPSIAPETRYEIEAQLNGSITMNVTLFTLFDHDLQDRLEAIEQYIIRLAEFHKGQSL